MEFLGDRDAIVADDRAPHSFSIRTDFGRGPSVHADGVGQLGDATQDLLAPGRTGKACLLAIETFPGSLVLLPNVALSQLAALIHINAEQC